MLVAGVDEVGRGPLAGPVVAAAVILPEHYDLPGLNDSKRLTEKKREGLYDAIRGQSVSWAIAEASVEEIDQLNILHASMLAMKRAVEQLVVTPDEAWVDGNRAPELAVPAKAIVKGDQLHPCISAASVLAKVARDRFMTALHEQPPDYGFASHAGYPTAFHREALKAHGPSPWHRRSFKPVQAALRDHAR